jgi:hypothetical protein
MMSALPDRRSRAGIAKCNVPVVRRAADSLTVTFCGTAAGAEPAPAADGRLEKSGRKRFSGVSVALSAYPQADNSDHRARTQGEEPAWA